MSQDMYDFQISEPLVQGIKNVGKITLSCLQALESSRKRKNVIVTEAQKSIVYSVVAIEGVEKSLDNMNPQVLVLCPKEKYCQLVHKVINSVGSYYNKLKCTNLELNQEEGHIVIATPVTLKKNIEENKINRNHIKLIIYYEFNQFENGMLESIDWILSGLNAGVQQLSFSYKYSQSSITKLNTMMKNVEHVIIKFKVPSLEKVKLFYVRLKQIEIENIFEDNKINCLLRILKTVSFNRCVVFTNRQDKANLIYDKLTLNNWTVALISQDSPNYKESDKHRVIVTTDYRYIRKNVELGDVNLVVNYDVPQNMKKLFQNCGCTGQYGTYGVSITICSKIDIDYLKEMAENLSLSLSPLPKEINPEYFFYMLNPTNDEKKIEKIHEGTR